MIRIGFDIGGTFTDLVLHDAERGKMVFHKILTTPADPTRAVMDGLVALIGSAEVKSEALNRFYHATTVATNAILERRGSATALVTTRGFRDIVLIGRQKRYNTYDLYLDKPPPLVRRRQIFEVDERIGFDGEVIEPLDMASVDAAIDAVLAVGYQSVAVVLLHSYANPAHERAVCERVNKRAPGISVTLSSDVSPRYREYERASTTVANAYVKPIIASYLDSLDVSLARERMSRSMMIMQSNGGLMSPELAREYPVRIIESGPAAGVLMCAAVGREEGLPHVITFDMGGTTAKLGAVDDGEPVITPTFEVDAKHFRRFSGLPLNVAAIELLEIGNGGGSIATTDMGLVRVGPTSAGAAPGPICYGRGGDRPTVTDANLVLGYIDPHFFNGGAMQLDIEAARRGITKHVAEPLAIDVVAAAWGIHAVANSNMESAMRVISIERGRDPRRYGLVAFGGAGPLHAARLARALGIPKVIVPYGAGVGSAVGLLNAEPKIDVSLTRIFPLSPGAHGQIANVYDELEARARQEIAVVSAGARPEWSRYAYLRYAGQGFEVRVQLPAGPIGKDYVTRCLAAFFGVYEKKYGYKDTAATVEAVDWQLVATVPGHNSVARDGFRLDRRGPCRGALAARRAYFPEAHGVVECAIVDRYAMTTETQIRGPAIIEESEATTVVLPGDVASLSPRGNLIIAVAEGGSR
jgi:N-methylhydantoinase A